MRKNILSPTAESTVLHGLLTEITAKEQSYISGLLQENHISDADDNELIVRELNLLSKFEIFQGLADELRLLAINAVIEALLNEKREVKEFSDKNKFSDKNRMGDRKSAIYVASVRESILDIRMREFGDELKRKLSMFVEANMRLHNIVPSELLEFALKSNERKLNVLTQFIQDRAINHKFTKNECLKMIQALECIQPSVRGEDDRRRMEEALLRAIDVEHVKSHIAVLQTSIRRSVRRRNPGDMITGCTSGADEDSEESLTASNAALAIADYTGFVQDSARVPRVDECILLSKETGALRQYIMQCFGNLDKTRSGMLAANLRRLTHPALSDISMHSKQAIIGRALSAEPGEFNGIADNINEIAKWCDIAALSMKEVDDLIDFLLEAQPKKIANLMSNMEIMQNNLFYVIPYKEFTYTQRKAIIEVCKNADVNTLSKFGCGYRAAIDVAALGDDVRHLVELVILQKPSTVMVQDDYGHNICTEADIIFGDFIKLSEGRREVFLQFAELVMSTGVSEKLTGQQVVCLLGSMVREHDWRYERGMMELVAAYRDLTSVLELDNNRFNKRLENMGPDDIIQEIIGVSEQRAANASIIRRFAKVTADTCITLTKVP